MSAFNNINRIHFSYNDSHDRKWRLHDVYISDRELHIITGLIILLHNTKLWITAVIIHKPVDTRQSSPVREENRGEGDEKKVW